MRTRMADAKAMTLEEVRSTLTGESAALARRRRAFRRIPSPPRCKLCAAPFAGVGGLVLRPAGFKRSPGNPSSWPSGRPAQSAAHAGEVIASVAAAEAAGADGLERCTVEIRGRVEPVEVVVLRSAEVELGVSS